MEYEHINPMTVPKEMRQAELRRYTEEPEEFIDDFLLTVNPTPHQVQSALMCFALSDLKPTARMELLQHLAIVGCLDRIFKDEDSTFSLAHILAMMADEMDELSYVIVLSMALSLGMKANKKDSFGLTALDIAQTMNNEPFLKKFARTNQGLVPSI